MFKNKILDTMNVHRNETYINEIVKCIDVYENVNFVRCDLNFVLNHFVFFKNCSFRDCSIRHQQLSDTHFVNCNFYSILFQNTFVHCNCVMAGCPERIEAFNSIFSNHNLMSMEILNYFRHAPETGVAFEGYKKADKDGEEVIVTLEVPADAERIGYSFDTTDNFKKCRVSKAIVKDIEFISRKNKKKKTDQVESAHSWDFKYVVGQMVHSKNNMGEVEFDRSLRECSTGIHLFLTKQEAIDYKWR